MSERVDICLLPVLPALQGYAIMVEGEACLASWRRTPEGGRWAVRSRNGRLLGTGRTVAAAVRMARATIRGEAP